MRPTQDGNAADVALRRAQALAGLVRDAGPDETGRMLDALDREALYALAVVLAAMLPIDESPADLLAWTRETPTSTDPYPEDLDQEPAA